MRTLNDGTEVPDIIRYVVLEHKAKNPELYSGRLEEMTKEEFVKYAKIAFNWHIGFIK